MNKLSWLSFIIFISLGVSLPFITKNVNSWYLVSTLLAAFLFLTLLFTDKDIYSKFIPKAIKLTLYILAGFITLFSIINIFSGFNKLLILNIIFSLIMVYLGTIYQNEIENKFTRFFLWKDDFKQKNLKEFIVFLENKIKR